MTASAELPPPYSAPSGSHIRYGTQKAQNHSQLVIGLFFSLLASLAICL